jgi:hypothetical protein
MQFSMKDNKFVPTETPPLRPPAYLCDNIDVPIRNSIPRPTTTTTLRGRTNQTAKIDSGKQRSLTPETRKHPSQKNCIIS